jgi:cobalamin biosynthesis Mg chelatase CobN
MKDYKTLILRWLFLIGTICFWVCFFLILFAGCKTTQTKAQIKQELSSTVNTNTSAVITEDKKESGTVSITDYANLTKDEILSLTSTIWSAPDSSGIQYPLQTINAVKTSRTQTDSGSKTEAEKTKETAINNVLSTQFVEESDFKSETKTDIKKEPNTTKAINIVIVLVVLGFLVMVFLILKRFKLIK